MAMSGCAVAPNRPIVSAVHALPPAPAEFGQPVPEPALVGHDARSAVRHALAALRSANGRLVNDGIFYGDALAHLGK